MRFICFLNMAYLMLLTSCATNKEEKTGAFDSCSVIAIDKVVNEDTLTVMNRPESISDTIDVPLSQLINKLEIVRLDSCQQAFAMPGANGTVALSEKYISVCDYAEPIKLFDRKTGSFLRQIGSIGAGPAEYFSGSSFQYIDEANNRYYTKSRDRILIYDLEGNYIKDHKLSKEQSNYPFLALNIEKQQFSVIDYFSHYSHSTPFIWVEDMEGNVIQKIDSCQLAMSQRVDKSGYNNGKRASFSFFNNPPIRDSLYIYDFERNRIHPRFTVDWRNDDNIGFHSLMEIPRYFIYYQQKDRVDFTPKSQLLPILIDKHSLKGAYARLLIDEWGGIPLLNLCFIWRFHYDQDRFFYSVIDPLQLLEEIEKRLEYKDGLPSRVVDRLEEMKNSITEDDNSWVLIGEWK